VLMLAALFWALRSMFTRSSDDSEYQDMLNELNRRRQQPGADPKTADPVTADDQHKVESLVLEQPEAGAALSPTAESDFDSDVDTNTAFTPAGASPSDADAGHDPEEPLPHAGAGISSQHAADKSGFDHSISNDDTVEDDADDLEALDADDWRDQIHAIMNEVADDDDHSAARQPSAKHDLVEHEADTSDSTMATDSDDWMAEDEDWQADDTHSGSYAQPAADAAAQHVTQTPEHQSAPPSDAGQRNDVATSNDAGNAVQQAHDSTQSAGEKSSADEQSDLLAPLKFDLSGEQGESSDEGAQEDDDNEAGTETDDSSSHADVVMTAPLAFTSGDAGDAASSDDEADAPEPDAEPSTTSSAPQSVDDSLPPLSFAAFADDEDDSEYAPQGSAAAEPDDSAASAHDIESNFDPFAESIPEPVTTADEDWLEEASTEQLLPPEHADSSADLQQQVPLLQTGSTLIAPTGQTAAQSLLPEGAGDASPEVPEAEAGLEGDDEFDSIEIKLDLARAYLAMGDHQAMRILLDEIGDQGNATQREEMASLLQQAQA